MVSILDDLWSGKIRPNENFAPNTSEYRELCKKISEETEYFRSVLSADDKKRYNELEELNDMLAEILDTEAFKVGFRLAAMLFSEVYSNKVGIADVLKIFGID